MPFGFGEIAVLGVVGAAMFLGPKRIIPKVAETLKLARETFAESSGKAAQAAKTTAEAPKAVKPPSKPVDVQSKSK
eukprot:gene8345-18543_t